MIHSIDINDFRLFKDVKIKLGKYITVIAGKNALGKSTILGLLGNSCEMKVSEGKPILQRQFRTEFSEIFKGSPKFDLSGSNKCIINFCEYDNTMEICDYRKCRVSWPKISKTNNNKRFRVIPEKFDSGKVRSSKYPWPVIYLGLSRLFPIGESKESDIHVENIKLSDYESEYFISNYKNILSIYDNNEISVDSIEIGETKRKTGVGISTNQYDSITNSAGQDNIGQIIMSVLSFRRLKLQKGTEYKGGLLLIDEIDATLHPYAQSRLFDYLYRECRELKLQVVFTTHSLHLLNEVSSKVSYNNESRTNNIELQYITKANGVLEVLNNPTYVRINNDLNITSQRENVCKIALYSEDKEARWFISKLMQEYMHRIRLVDVSLGYGNLLQLFVADYKYYSNVLFVLDGDVGENDINKYTHGNNQNIVVLPGEDSIEKIFYNYMLNLPYEHKLITPITDYGYTKEYLQTHIPVNNGSMSIREQYKKWFNDSMPLIEGYDIFTYWKDENKDICDKFINDFREKFNIIAKRNFYPTIR